MDISTWVSIAAVLIAAASFGRTIVIERRARARERKNDAFIEEERRLRSVAFELEYESQLGGWQSFTLWNIGTAECLIDIDRAALARWAVEPSLLLTAKPGEPAGQILIRPDESLGLPRSVSINVSHPFDAKRVVRVPRAGRATIPGADPPDARS